MWLVAKGPTYFSPSSSNAKQRVPNFSSSASSPALLLLSWPKIAQHLLDQRYEKQKAFPSFRDSYGVIPIVSRVLASGILTGHGRKEAENSEKKKIKCPDRHKKLGLRFIFLCVVFQVFCLSQSQRVIVRNVPCDVKSYLTITEVCDKGKKRKINSSVF